MTDTEFMLEVIKRASVARRSLCGARKDVILANAQALMAREEVACLEDLIRWEREAMELRDTPPSTGGG